jgi:hypothetical protein
VGEEKYMAWFNNVDTSKKYRLGTKNTSVAGDEFIYLTGVGSTVLGDWVTFDEAHITTRAVANGQGRVAVAQGAVNAVTSFGWYQVYGTGDALALTGFADNGKVFLTSTAGSIDDSDVGGDFVVGAIGRGAVNETTLLAAVELNYPVVQDTAFD